jgi:dTDP-4-amino-4,6-dideoxygalactose transaminase
MIEIAAAMGMVNLDAIDSMIATNKRNYLAYREGLSELQGISLVTFDEAESNNFQYIVMEVSEECPLSRNQIIKILHAENILARKYFWPGCHNMKPYSELFPHAGSMLPNTQQVAERVIVLPTGTAMSEEMIKLLISAIDVALK